MENSEQSSEQSSEQTSNEEGGQAVDTNTSSQSEETQGASTGEQADTSSEIKSNGSTVGLQKSEPDESVDSSKDFSNNLDALVNAALNDELTAEQRQQLDDGGLGSHFDMIVSGHRAKVAENDAQIVGVVGGKEAYGELQEWALSNLDDSEIESFNMAVLESGNIGLAKLAVEGLQARYHKANGQAPQKRIEAGGTANEASRPFADVHEYINETMSRKYRQDPEYAAQIEAKRNISGF
jgi:hypothetical protein